MEDKKSIRVSLSQDRIQTLWDGFVNAESKSYEKSVWFDVFLAEFLAEIKEGKKVNEILSAGLNNVGGVSTLIGCELLSDVHEICSASGDGEELTSVLCKHLFSGRGWRCLSVLQSLGMQDVSCGRELASLLISLYAVGGEAYSSTDTVNPYVHISHISSLRVDKICKPEFILRRKSRSVVHSIENSPPGVAHKINGTSSVRSRTAHLNTVPELTKEESSESEHGGSSEPPPLRSSLKIRLDPMDFDYFTSVVRSEDESRLESSSYTPVKKKQQVQQHKLQPEDFHNDRIKDVLKHQINCYEFKLLLIELLQGLTESENFNSQAVGVNHLVSIQVMSFSLVNLCSLQFASAPVDNMDSKQLSNLKSVLSKLLLTALDKILFNSELTAAAVQKGILPVMLRLCEDMVRKTTPEIMKEKELEELEILQEFVFNLIYGMIRLIHCLLVHNSALDKVKKFLLFFHQFSDSCNGKLVFKTIISILNFPQIDSSMSINRAKKLILLVSQLIMSMKKTRSKLVHVQHCKRSRHKHCLLNAMHHHDNLFGKVYTSSILPSSVQQNCSITTLFMILTNFLSDDMPIEIVIQSLQAMTACGTCCCFPPYILITKLLKVIVNGDQRLRNTGLILLEKIFYRQMGALDEKTCCEICLKNTKMSFSVEDIEKLSKCSTSGEGSSGTLNSDIRLDKNKWSCLDSYRDLLLSNDPKISYTIGSHLLRVVPRCSMLVQYEIMFTIFYPVFLIANQRYSETKSNVSTFVMTTCLSAFANLLSHVRFIEQFVELKAMERILDLLHDSHFMKLCCSIIELVIIVHVWKLECVTLNTNVNNILREHNITELYFLMENTVANTKKCLTLFENKDSDESTSDCVVYSDQVNITFDSVENWMLYYQLIENVTILWKTCANLSLYSPQVKAHFSSETVSAEAHSFLMVLLQKLGKIILIKGDTNEDKIHTTVQMHMKLLESLLVFCITCPCYDIKKGCVVTTENIIVDLKIHLLNSLDKNIINVKQACDILFRVSLAQPSHQLLLPTHRMSKVGIPLYDGSGCTVSQAAGMTTPYFDEPISDHDSTPDMTADEGYEADVEIIEQTVDDEAKDDSSETTNLSSTNRNVCNAGEHRKKHNIVHAGLCVLAVDIIVHVVQSIMNDVKDKVELLGCVCCLHRLSSLCCDSVNNCGQLAQHSLVTKLLTDFSDVLSSVSDPTKEELQCAILQLVTLIAKHTVRPHDLIQYLRFFTEDNPPVESLLLPLIKLVSSYELQPTSVMMFPSTNVESKVLLSPSASPAEKTAITMHQQHVSLGLQSSWACSALALPINTDLGWSMWINGFSVAVWIKWDKLQNFSPNSQLPPNSLTTGCDSTMSESFSDNLSETWCHDGKCFPPNVTAEFSSSSSQKVSSKQQNLLHVFSVGFDVMVLEFWINTNTGTLVIRLMRPDGKRQEILSESTVDGHLSISTWHHLAINIKDCVQKKKVIIEVTLIINGCVELQIPLTFTGLLIRKARPSCVLLGHTGSVNGVLYFGSLLMFRAPVFDRENAVSLLAHGPDYVNITQADVGNAKPNHTAVLKTKALVSGVKWETVLDEQENHLKELQQNLLLTYSAGHWNTVNLYPQVINNSAGVVGSLFPPGPGFRVAAIDNRPSQLLPMNVTPILFAPTSIQDYHGITVAINAIGGLSVILFLFARVVELQANEECQAKALYLLLKLAQSTTDLCSEFATQNCHKLISYVFSTKYCTTGLHVLKAIFDVCCDHPGVINYHSVTGQFCVTNQSDAIIVDAKLISVSILSSWKEWEFTEVSYGQTNVLVMFFQGLHALLRDDHPHREFNASQLNRVKFIDALLYFCKERFLCEEGIPPLDPTVCISVVEVIRALMTAPPDFSHIVAIYDYLVLAHPANDTHVSLVRPSFYFLLSSISSTSPTKRDNSIKSSSTFSESENKSKKYFNEAVGSVFDTKSIKENLTQPIDPSKLNKALANLQIKQSSERDNEELLYRKRSVASGESVDSNRVDEINSDSGYLDTDNEILKQDVSLDESTENNKKLIPSEPLTPDQHDSELDELEKADESGTELMKETALSSSKPNNWEIQYVVTGDDNQEKREDTHPLVTGGLLLLLRDIILVLPDNMAHQVLSHIIKIEGILVMVNHRSSDVRITVVKLLSAYLQRASEDEIERFLNMKGFYQLANQLSLYNASVELVEGVVSMVTGFHWLPLEEQLDDEDSRNVVLTPLQLAALSPLLALLPQTVHNLPLAHSLLHFLQRLFTKVPSGKRALMDCGLLEVLSKTIVVISHLPPEPSDMCGVTEQDLLLGDIHSYFISTVSSVINTPGNHNMQVLTDILLHMKYLEKLELTYCGQHAPCVANLRSAQCIIFDLALDLIHDKITQQTVSRIRTTATALFSSVLSPGYEDLLGELQNIQGRTVAATRSSTSDSVASLTSGSNTTAHTGGSGNSAGAVSKTNRVPRSEIIDRFKMIVNKAVEFFIYSESINTGKIVLSTKETNLVKYLLTTLLAGLNMIVERKSGPRSTYATIMWSCRDVIRTMCSQLFIWLLSPLQTNKLRMYVVNTIRNEPHARDVLSSVLLSNSQIEQQFALYLWELMYGPESVTLSSVDMRACEYLCESVQAWGIMAPQAMGHKHDPWFEDVVKMLNTVQTQRTLWAKQQESIMHRTVNKMESTVKGVIEAGMIVTKAVVEAQNAERKTLMEQIKMTFSDCIHAQLQWKSLVKLLTHERAIWHFPNSYPRSWQLDQTEGPARVRTRLQRCHLTMNKRFLKPEFRDKLDATALPQPLSYLFNSETSTLSSVSAVMIEKLHTDEKIRHMATARIITPSSEVPGELLIGESCLYFVPSSESSMPELIAGSVDICSQAWLFEEIKEVHNRRFQLQERGLEIFLLNGKTYLLAFETSADRDMFSTELSHCELPHRVASDHLSDAVQLWREGHLTNWEYLTTLNKMAGRSYNDLMQYPVMPFVLADYTSTVLDLTDPKSFRIFKKPMAVQDKKNEQHYISSYNYLKQEYADALNVPLLNQEPYHYGSHYSNSGTVLHFLVRLPPFTSMLLSYQDNNFDLPDRTFHSLHTTWRLTSSESTTDVKELIPEFFFLPEFLLNFEGFDFGVRQNGMRVDDVALPPWAFGDHRRFILIHRQALESDYVRENLPLWIDLVFGYKQTGKAAVDSINVFHPATYYGFDVESITDPLERCAWETMVRTYGQTPRQLFRAAHPMVVQSLAPKTNIPSVIPGVKGLSWGNYVGSPGDCAPAVIWQQNHRTPVASLIPLLTNDVFGLAPNTALLLAYSKEKTLSLVTMGGTCVLGAALVMWGQNDGIVRAKLKKEQPPYPAIRPPHGGIITKCTSVPDCNQLWIGYSTGKILVYKYKFVPSKGTLEFSSDPIILLGHTSAVLSLTLCRSFSVALSGSQDGSAILWDLNTLSYIRSLPNISLPVTLTCISETMGELITIGHDADSGGSTVRLHTINVSLVGSITTRDQITAVSFSTAPEGISVNIVATGMINGVIRLWSTWDLTPVGEITLSTLQQPIISLTYSYDSQHLYVSTASGSVIIWEGSAAKTVSKTPKFLNLTSLI